MSPAYHKNTINFVPLNYTAICYMYIRWTISSQEMLCSALCIFFFISNCNRFRSYDWLRWFGSLQDNLCISIHVNATSNFFRFFSSFFVKSKNTIKKWFMKMLSKWTTKHQFTETISKFMFFFSSACPTQTIYLISFHFVLGTLMQHCM